MVGSHAVSHYVQPRVTKDLDLLIRDTQENAEALYRALPAFGSPLSGLSPQDFREPELVFEIGVEPSRIDLLQSLTGVDSEQAWSHRVPAHITEDRIPTNFISAADLLLTKLALGRLQDLADAEKLQATQTALANRKENES